MPRAKGRKPSAAGPSGCQRERSRRSNRSLTEEQIRIILEEEDEEESDPDIRPESDDDADSEEGQETVTHFAEVDGEALQQPAPTAATTAAPTAATTAAVTAPAGGGDSATAATADPDSDSSDDEQLHVARQLLCVAGRM